VGFLAALQHKAASAAVSCVSACLPGCGCWRQACDSCVVILLDCCEVCFFWPFFYCCVLFSWFYYMCSRARAQIILWSAHNTQHLRCTCATACRGVCAY
jgi:hypothetical protein